MKRLIRCTFLLITALVFGASRAQAQTLNAQAKNPNNNMTTGREFKLADLLAPARPQKRAGLSLMPASSLAQQPQSPIVNLVVLGGGTAGRVAKWTGSTLINSFIGDSNIFEDNTGKVGIGTTAPASPLTVAGMIQTTLGGIKFPDGTVQTTAATGGLATVAHNETLTGNGTIAAPLSVAIPLKLVGSLAFALEGILTVQNTAEAGTGVFAGGGGGVGLVGGSGVRAEGGLGFLGGSGVESRGGDGADGNGFGPGDGVVTIGGSATAAGTLGGTGIRAIGGDGFTAAEQGLAADFFGDVEIVGNFSVNGTKNFKIDHPLDPENKYLIHAAIESSEVLNVYSGNTKLDANGEAVVQLPEWFEALNKDYRYSLTPVGAPAQGLYVAEEISGNRFKIAGGKAEMKVSWQVTGIRSDAAMRNHPFRVEEGKPERERGTYLSPEAFNQPEERGVQWVRNSRTMQQLKERRLEREQTRRRKANDR